MMHELPHGWVTAPLNRIAQINPRHPKGLDDTRVVTFVRMAGLSESRPEFQFTEHRTLAEVRKGFTHFAEGDVLFAKITPCMENGKGAVANGLRNGLGCGTTEMHVIRPRAGLDSHYLYRFLAQPSIRQAAQESFTGTAGQASVPLSFIEELEIPLAPLNEQHRIVAKVEALLAKVGASQKRLANIPAVLKRFRQAVLATAYSGRLTADLREEAGQDNELVVRKLSDLGTVTGGITKNASRQKMRMQVPYLRVANVYENRLELNQVLDIGVTEQEYRRTRLKKDDLLFVEGNGSLDQIGRVALWNGLIPHCVHQNHLIKFRASNTVQPSYVLFYMMSPKGRQQLVEKSTSTAGLNTLSISKIEDLDVPFFSIEEQQQIVFRIRELFTVADRIEARYEQAKGQIDKLTPSILAKAFRGELVPTEAELAEAEGRDFETAAELLARIKSTSPDASDGNRARARGHTASSASS